MWGTDWEELALVRRTVLLRKPGLVPICGLLPLLLRLFASLLYSRLLFVSLLHSCLRLFVSLLCSLALLMPLLSLLPS